LVSFNWGDGSAESTSTLANGSTTASAVHTYTKVGLYSLMSQLTDNTKQLQGKTQTITVNAPVVTGPTLYENANRSGPIYSDEIWKGVIDITGDVSIYPPATVTIEPGTMIRFSANSDDQHGGGNTAMGDENKPITDSNFPNDPPTAPSQMSSIGVFGGTLRAVGTPDHTITFTSSAQNPKPGDWHSLQYNNSDSRLILQYTTIEYSYYGVQISDTASDSTITLNNNIIRNVVACGICNGVDPLRPVTITIANNDISYCGHEGVDTHANANVIIENNAFHANWNGVILGNNDSIIRNNQFTGNTSFAIYIINSSSHPSIYGNTFINNQENCNIHCQ
jgi:parallel beta-helix repeat protein